MYTFPVNATGQELDNKEVLYQAVKKEDVEEEIEKEAGITDKK